jgi:hypothetical protein
MRLHSLPQKGLSHQTLLEVEELLRRGADVNSRDSGHINATPLHKVAAMQTVQQTLVEGTAEVPLGSARAEVWLSNATFIISADPPGIPSWQQVLCVAACTIDLVGSMSRQV